MSGCWYIAFVYSIMAWAVTVSLGIQSATEAVWPRVISKGFNNYMVHSTHIYIYI